MRDVGEPQPVVELRGITKTYRLGGATVHALAGVDLRVDPGEMVAVMGQSGSGKSTLMNVLGCLDRPTAGEYLLAGRAVARLRDDELAEVRNRTIGFVFQSFNLLPRLTALQNVELPLIYRDEPARQRREASREALEAVGLAGRLHHLPAQLSGGQQQRVAVARALAARPRLLLADEPTGNLDSRSGREVMALFQDLNDRGMTLILVTHDAGIGHHCRRIVSVLDGRVVGDEPVGGRLLARNPAPAGIGSGPPVPTSGPDPGDPRPKAI
jgi:putative ABC transport system ATP-binding protein